MASLNIPSYHTDPNYRYRMPRVKAKTEGRGNGIKTNIMNMGDIAKALKRPAEYATKFCGCELGASSKFVVAEGKAIVNGKHSEQDVQAVVDKFIERFVLCPGCRLPEIDLRVYKGRVMGVCNACGHNGDMDNVHKVSTYIVKNPPTGTDSTMGNKDKTGGTKGTASTSSADTTATATATATKKKDKEKDKEKEKEKEKEKTKSKSGSKSGSKSHSHHPGYLVYSSTEMESVVSRLAGFAKASRLPQDVYQEARLLQVAQDFTATKRVYITMRALCGSVVDVEAVTRAIPFIQAVCDRSTGGDAILEALEQTVWQLKYRQVKKCRKEETETLTGEDGVTEQVESSPEVNVNPERVETETPLICASPSTKGDRLKGMAKTLSVFTPQDIQECFCKYHLVAHVLYTDNVISEQDILQRYDQQPQVPLPTLESNEKQGDDQEDSAKYTRKQQEELELVLYVKNLAAEGIKPLVKWLKEADEDDSDSQSDSESEGQSESQSEGQSEGQGQGQRDNEGEGEGENDSAPM